MINHDKSTVSNGLRAKFLQGLTVGHAKGYKLQPGLLCDIFAVPTASQKPSLSARSLTASTMNWIRCLGPSCSFNGNHQLGTLSSLDLTGYHDILVDFLSAFGSLRAAPISIISWVVALNLRATPSTLHTSPGICRVALRAHHVNLHTVYVELPNPSDMQMHFFFLNKQGFPYLFILVWRMVYMHVQIIVCRYPLFEIVHLIVMNPPNQLAIIQRVVNSWEFQDPETEVLYHILSHKALFCGYIALQRPYIDLTQISTSDLVA